MANQGADHETQGTECRANYLRNGVGEKDLREPLSKKFLDIC